MDAALKQKWITALRSGNYEQGIGQLRTQNNTYCCLGVLCEVAGIPWEFDGDEWAVRYRDSDGEDGNDLRQDTIPQDYREFFGLSSEDQERLIHLNDSQGVPFSGIADWIDAHL